MCNEHAGLPSGSQAQHFKMLFITTFLNDLQMKNAKVLRISTSGMINEMSVEELGGRTQDLDSAGVFEPAINTKLAQEYAVLSDNRSQQSHKKGSHVSHRPGKSYNRK